MTDLPILGVDAGGTGTRAVLVRSGVVTERFSEGPLNVLLHPDAVDRLVRLIARSGAALAGLGLPGVNGVAEAERLQSLLRARTGVAVVVSDDVEVALLGAFNGGPGIVVSAGTGSNAIGRDARGVTARVGGHGFLLGDEGSGYWIGAQALRAALRSADGTGPRSRALEAAVTGAYQESLAAIVRRVHSAPTDRHLVARITSVIAPMDDPVVDRILTRAARHLARLADALRERLGPLPVAMAGGVFGAPPVRERFVAATGAVDGLATTGAGGCAPGVGGLGLSRPGVATVSLPGSLMAAEIAEQPTVLAGILDDGGPEIRRVATVIRAAAPRFVLFAARGTSAHAALYAKYLVEVALGLPVGFASPATVTAYAARPDLRDVLFVAVSQSGGSPDLIEALTNARRCGALTLAVTNAPGSALAQAAELALDVRAGAERAVAATKTYTAELLTLYLLIDALRGGDGRSAAGLPEAVRAVVATSEAGRGAGGAAEGHRSAGGHGARIRLPHGA